MVKQYVDLHNHCATRNRLCGSNIVLTDFVVDSDAVENPGLSAAEAAARLAKDGFNELPSTKQRGIVAFALDVVREPMFLLLVAASAIYFVLGDLAEALVLVASIFVVMGITIFQTRKTERALDALRDLSTPRALVLRDGIPTRIPGREVVCGDTLMLKEGDRVPADGVLISAHDLSVDESLLTGESVPVGKTAGDPGTVMIRPGGDGLPFVYSGTLLVQGHGVAQVVATGARTEFGRIGKALQTIDAKATRLQRETGIAVRRLAIGGLILCALVVLLHGLTRGVWLEGFLAGITLAMAILPEEFPVVLTVFLALGAWRISRRGVLTRHMPAVETLGSATVLCVDKTGTLTFNRMAVQQLYAGGAVINVASAETRLPDAFHAVLECAMLASELHPFDPMEKAIVELAEHEIPNARRRQSRGTLVREYPLTSRLLAHTHAWRGLRSDEACLLATKGAPEAIADLCRLTPEMRREMDTQVATMASSGLRVLGVAEASFDGTDWPPTPEAFHFEWLGLVALADPVRPTVAAAVRECHAAGIRVVMITGDYPLTARAIARQIGLRPVDSVITGVQLTEMSDEELRERIARTSIFARVVPEQKLRLIEAFKANGDIVAMTGDGVNDAPALKAADIGIAMGARGTDVAREASSLVLIDDDFDSIVHAVRLGRRIYRNIAHAMAYLIAVHIPTAGMAFIPIIFGWPMAFFPVHIVFFEFVIDPACSIVFEAEPDDASVMRQPPRSPDSHLFSARAVAASVVQGLAVLLAVAAVYGLALTPGPEPQARAMAFATIVFGNLGLILVNRSEARAMLTSLAYASTALWLVIGGTLTALMLVLYVPYLRDLFRLSALSLTQVLICLTAAGAGVLVPELYKHTSRSR